MLITIVAVLLVIVAFALVSRRRSAALDELEDIDTSLGTYREIRQFLGSHMLSAYPSLVPSDLRIRLQKQLGSYGDICDDASELRWERLWMPKLIEVADSLSESDAVRQDSEFADIVDGFKTNERLIDDAKRRREGAVRRLRPHLTNDMRELVRDSHHKAAPDDADGSGRSTNSKVE